MSAVRTEIGDQPEAPRPARDSAYFDRWYSDMRESPVKDGILERHLGFPEDFGPAGVVPYEALDEIVAQLWVPEGGTVADIACGRGGYGIELARRSDARLVGVDFSAVALEQARVTAARRLDENQAEFSVGTLTATGLTERSVHGLLCSDSVQFAEVLSDALDEFRRVLVSGGRLALTTWQAAEPGDPAVSERIRRLDDLEKDLTTAGFLNVVVEDRPAWRDAEKGLYEEAVATPNDGDEALSSLQGEGRKALPNWSALRRVVAFATAP